MEFLASVPSNYSSDGGLVVVGCTGIDGTSGWLVRQGMSWAAYQASPLVA